VKKVIFPIEAFHKEKFYCACQGIKTFWPDHYKVLDILHETERFAVMAAKEMEKLEATSGTLTKPYAYIGFTKDGIKIKCVLHHKTKKIITAFPCGY